MYKNGKVGLWHPTFTILPAHSAIGKTYLAGRLAEIIAAQNRRWGVIDGSANVLVPFKFDAIERHAYLPGLYITTLRKLHGAVVVKTSYPPIANKYEVLAFDRSFRVSNGWTFQLFKVANTGRWGYVGENGIEYFSD
jgi:hypothetical protein